jgi:antitoxin component YwqK of YwqJK toxin-antitoxin module
MRPTITHYPNGQLECEGFVNGEIQVGSWTFYHESGKVFSKGQFDDSGNPIGVWTEYYENGQIKYEAISSQGNCFSLDNDNLEIINYWTEDGTPLIVDGNGKLTTYFDNGNIQHISYWTEKLKNGTFQEFYENGQLKIEREYKDGVKDGIGKVFSENGTLIYEYYYLNGEPIGKVREWYESGQIAEEGEGTFGLKWVNKPLKTALGKP